MSHHYLHFERVSYRYPNGYEALHDVTFHITHGEKTALVGMNGAGKSTLLLHLAGLLLPTSGEAIVGGIRLTPRTLATIRRAVGLVFQNPDNQLFMPTVEEDVAFGPANMQLTPEEIERRVTEALAAVGALHLRRQAPYHLSGGQKRSVAIATVLAMEPSVLLLDEPTSNLDPRARRQTIDLLRGFDHTMLLATHDMEMVLDLCPRTIVLHDGRIAADDATAVIFRDSALLDACGLEAPCSVRSIRKEESIE
ncbi:MAG: energy-coupling factor ABC transporter ATP-binding protein [Alistipes sp.]|nr:energy-coupling factor ABC transporter ATP-binding protein [Alistipes sp.]